MYWKTNPCEGEGCSESSYPGEPFCPRCKIRVAQEKASEELEVLFLARRELERLELHLKFEAWADEHEG